MKKIFFILIAIMGIFVFSGTSFAVNESEMTGAITLTDTVSGGPGVQNLAVSANSFVTFTAAEFTVGRGFNVMGVTAASGKSSDEEAIQFAVFGNQAPGQLDDNNVYQKSLAPSAGEAGTPTSAIAWQNPTDANNWVIRGVGSASTFVMPSGVTLQ